MPHGTLSPQAPLSDNGLQRRAQMIEPPSPDRFHVARNLAEVVDAWRLVYKVYTRSGLIPQNPYGVHTVPQAMNRRTAVFYSLTGPFVESTVTTIFDGAGGLPLDVVYKRELDVLRRKGRRLNELSLLAHAAQIAGSQAAEYIEMNSAVPSRLHAARVRTSLIHLMCRTFFFGLAMDCTDFVIGIHPKHARFYERGWGFQQIGPEHTHPTVNNRPVVLMRMAHSDILRKAEQPYALEFCLNNPIPLDTFCERCRFEPREIASASGPIYPYIRNKYPDWEQRTIAWSQRKVV